MEKKVLIVEDDAFLREALVLFCKIQPYEVYATANGVTALFLCKEKKPDVLILDINLPDIMGTDVILKIKDSEEEYGSPKIIVISGIAYSMNDVKDRWMKNYGVDDFFLKPFVFEKLLKSIKNLHK